MVSSPNIFGTTRRTGLRTVNGARIPEDSRQVLRGKNAGRAASRRAEPGGSTSRPPFQARVVGGLAATKGDRFRDRSLSSNLLLFDATLCERVRQYTVDSRGSYLIAWLLRVSEGGRIKNGNLADTRQDRAVVESGSWMSRYCPRGTM